MLARFWADSIEQLRFALSPFNRRRRKKVQAKGRVNISPLFQIHGCYRNFYALKFPTEAACCPVIEKSHEMVWCPVPRVSSVWSRFERHTKTRKTRHSSYLRAPVVQVSFRGKKSKRVCKRVSTARADCKPPKSPFQNPAISPAKCRFKIRGRKFCAMTN
jgi:hypothetical protein